MLFCLVFFLYFDSNLLLTCCFWLEKHVIYNKLPSALDKKIFTIYD